jgi:hypothetical protein
LGNVSTFGFRGEGQEISSYRMSFGRWHNHVALASAADLSCLEISSRTTRSQESWSIIFKVKSCTCKSTLHYNYCLARAGNIFITDHPFAGDKSKRGQWFVYVMLSIMCVSQTTNRRRMFVRLVLIVAPYSSPFPPVSCKNVGVDTPRHGILCAYFSRSILLSRKHKWISWKQLEQSTYHKDTKGRCHGKLSCVLDSDAMLYRPPALWQHFDVFTGKPWWRLVLNFAMTSWVECEFFIAHRRNQGIFWGHKPGRFY